MASVGIRRRVSRRTGRVTYQVWWLLDDGSQGAETVASKDQARALAAQKRLQITRDTWQGRRRGRLPFNTWADLWWADWSADPHRSPHTLVMPRAASATTCALFLATAPLPREREVLGLIAEGMSNRAMAARLYVTERTVEAHVTQIFQKLGLPESPDQHRRVLAVLAFLRA
jgi:ATP/maltotriose-dependent transcriptional regulator MalT